MTSDLPLRSASISLEDRWLLWARARLYLDRLELTGWSLSGRYRRSISLGRIDEAEPTDGHLTLHLVDGSSLQVLMDAPQQWASVIAMHRDVREGAE